MSAPTQTEATPHATVATPPADHARIVFVGGTGRSGTHVIAKLLGRDRHYTLIPMECRFHVNAEGFPGLLAGTVTKEAFLRRMRGHWWRQLKIIRFRGFRGLHRRVARPRFERALEAFDRRFDADREAACAQLFLDLLWPERAPQDASWQGIVEQSCNTIAQAETLVRLFPAARFVHAVRDGRDASASRVRQARWLLYPRTRRQGLEWWESRIRRSACGARAIPKGRLLEVELGALLFRTPGGRVRKLARRRVRRLAQFAGVRVEGRMRRFAGTRMSFEAANEGRWRRGLSERRQREIDALYVEALERLERDGASCAPLLRRAYRRSQAHAQG